MCDPARPSARVSTSLSVATRAHGRRGAAQAVGGLGACRGGGDGGRRGRAVQGEGAQDYEDSSHGNLLSKFSGGSYLVAEGFQQVNVARPLQVSGNRNL